MKKIALAMILASASFGAMATAACADSTTGSGSAVTGSSANFIKNNFTPKCSANVYMDYDQTATVVGVGSGSKRGKNVFSGNSEGGAVKPTGTTCASGCSATESAAAATAAKTAGSSS